MAAAQRFKSPGCLRGERGRDHMAAHARLHASRAAAVPRLPQRQYDAAWSGVFHDALNGLGALRINPCVSVPVKPFTSQRLLFACLGPEGIGYIHDMPSFEIAIFFPFYAGALKPCCERKEDKGNPAPRMAG